MDTISISKFKASCSAVLDQVNETGEPLIVTRQGVPLVQLLPASEPAAEAPPPRDAEAAGEVRERRRPRSGDGERRADRRRERAARHDDDEAGRRGGEEAPRRHDDEAPRQRAAEREPRRSRHAEAAPPEEDHERRRRHDEGDRRSRHRLDAQQREPEAAADEQPATVDSRARRAARSEGERTAEPDDRAGRRAAPDHRAARSAPERDTGRETEPERGTAGAAGSERRAARDAEPAAAPGDRQEARSSERPRRLRRADRGRRGRPADVADSRHRIQAIPQHPVETTEGTFDALGLSPPVLEVLNRVGFVHPTRIQAQVLPPALEGRDIIGLAQTGSGKTAAFCLPLAERFYHGRGTRGLILSPTREIALQTKAFLDLFGEDHGLDTVCLIGGVRMGPQIRGLKNQPDLIVATPGRLLDHLRRRNTSLDKLEELVLDEADHMLDLGFLPQISELLEYVPGERRTMMFSATMPDDIKRLANRLMVDPVRIDLTPKGRAAEGIDHRLYLVEPDDKKHALLALLNQELGSTLVFIRRKIDAEWLARVLEKEGHPVERIHSDLSQRHRLDALAAFREGEHRILVATDVAARGLDIPRIQHIVNFDLPDNVEDYIHRAGRTARGSLKGVVSSIGTWQDKVMVRDIEAALDEKLPRCTLSGVEPYEEHKPRRSMRRRGKLKVRRRL